MFNKHYASYYDLFNSDKKYKKEIEFVYSWAENPKRILDLGCGTANYWQYYPEDVFIKGIERSKDMISIHDKNIQCAEIGDFSGIKGHYGLTTALFDVINYIPKHDWWMNIPMFPGAYFIFDIWDKEKVDKEGFKTTDKFVGEKYRTIIPSNYDGKTVDLKIIVLDQGIKFEEDHKMYIWSHEDIKKFCGDEFEIVDTKATRKWQKWYKLRRK